MQPSNHFGQIKYEIVPGQGHRRLTAIFPVLLQVQEMLSAHAANTLFCLPEIRWSARNRLADWRNYFAKRTTAATLSLIEYGGRGVAGVSHKQTLVTSD